MTGLYPPTARELRRIIGRMRQAQTKAELSLRARDAANLVKHELAQTERVVLAAMTKAEAEREGLLELLRAVNETRKEKLNELKEKPNA